MEDPKTPAPGVHLTLAQLAGEFALDERAAAELAGAVPPSGARDGAPVWRVRDLLDHRLRADDGAVDPEKLEPCARLNHFRAELERLKALRELGTVIARDAFEREIAALFKRVARELDLVVDEIERKVGAPASWNSRVEACVDAVREIMYAELADERA